MNMNIYTVWDMKAGVFLAPFTIQSDGLARRAMAGCLMEDEHMFARHPEDFALFHVGEWDDLTAGIEPCTPRAIATLLEIRIELHRVQEAQSTQLSLISDNQEQSA